MATVLVTGATGFVGHHLVPALVDEGHIVRCLVRQSSDTSVLPEDAVDFAIGDVTKPTGLAVACEGCDGIVHLVGIIAETGSATFERIHVTGTRNIIDAGREAGVKRVLYVSGLGAGPKAQARYHKTKWQAEEIVRKSGMAWTILRPSIIVGEGDGFTASILGLFRKGPFVPIAGDGRMQLQPIYIDDLCRCLAWCLAHPESAGQAYEIGGPEHLTFEKMVDEVARLKGVRKRKVHVPMAAVRAFAGLQERFSSRPDITRDQLKMMAKDNVCDPDVLRKVFGFPGTPYRQALGTFLKAGR
jgi:NADH dehydrogenase